MAEGWYIKVGGAERGPISSAELRELVRIGTVTPQVLVRRGSSAWIRASKVRGLFPSPPPETAHEREPRGPAPVAPAEATPDAEGPAGSPPGVIGFEPDAQKPEAKSPVDVGGNPLEMLGIQIVEQGGPVADEGPVELPGLELPEEPLRPRSWIRRPPEPPKPEPEKAPEEAPDDRAFRKRHLGTERLIRSIGIFFSLNVVVLIAIACVLAYRTLRTLNQIAGTRDLGPFHGSVLVGGSILGTGIVAFALIGGGLRKLQVWARWVAATLLIESILVSLVTELYLVLVHAPNAFSRALALLALGLLIPSLLAFALLGAGSEAVFSKAYADLIARTPRMRSGFSLRVGLLLLVELVAIGYLWYNTR